MLWSGYSWKVVNSSGERWGPGPNYFKPQNVWVDGNGKLHLKISHEADGKWYCATLVGPKLGLGVYQWQIETPLVLDNNVCLGLFNYGGVDYINEIDIEFSRWGESAWPNGNYTVYPKKQGILNKYDTFEFNTMGSSTHRFIWGSGKVQFYSFEGYQNIESIMNKAHNWSLTWNQTPVVGMPIMMDLWLLSGLPPLDGKAVEIVIKSFKYIR